MNLLLFPEQALSTEGILQVSGVQLQHLRNVLRSSIGDTIRVGKVNGSMGTGRVIEIDERRAVIDVTLDQSPPPKLALTLLLALPRPKMLRRILRMVAELGVGELHLINSYRVQKSYWQTPILEDASIENYFMQGLEQARDTCLPSVNLQRRFKPFVEDDLPDLVSGKRALVAHPGDYPPCPGPAAPLQHTVLAIGPEGGFIPYEIDMLQAAGFAPISLGPRILRVETAVPTLVAKLC
ncbi:16S rRNA (uracil(1498)-N(3))-methyltransferase [Halieaceae bacterium IMCC14734]|uniref:Ribosomal RNA small subunit methyltransferase E n=1 Tax=Candidatus Litorirhabdus singularis TaxID=2518993 RepID=A0ABT3TFN9_9GAMM|nr:16S rRNA (uracil(1498)-N(3))-methyltransferase [Candidatus Litorirhabdus singularis]MCX2981133.1 16S rRNA (uracil(1498)-N(3))-methyltransferase [Candidatus Litorirhabdus singularis]